MDKAKRLQDWILEHPRVSPTLSECDRFFKELDELELLPEHRDILLLLMDGKGNITKVDGKWRQLSVNKNGHAGGITIDDMINTMIDLELLYAQQPGGFISGMTHYAYVTDAGEEALKQ